MTVMENICIAMGQRNEEKVKGWLKRYGLEGMAYTYPVSYTHLDVYKRQCHNSKEKSGYHNQYGPACDRSRPGLYGRA